MFDVGDKVVPLNMIFDVDENARKYLSRGKVYTIIYIRVDYFRLKELNDIIWWNSENFQLDKKSCFVLDYYES
jgi:hypothetical protein